MPSRHSQGGSTLANLRYSAFVDSLLAAVPEIKRRHDALQEDIGPDILPYPTVELVLEPFVKDLLKANPDIELVRRVFAFFEEMAKAQDGHQTLGSGPGLLDRCGQLPGPDPGVVMGARSAAPASRAGQFRPA